MFPIFLWGDPLKIGGAVILFVPVFVVHIWTMWWWVADERESNNTMHCFGVVYAVSAKAYSPVRFVGLVLYKDMATLITNASMRRYLIKILPIWNWTPFFCLC